MKNPALEDRIAAAPDDDAPRLVYADWLTERGVPRGEFIALQCELARGVADRERREGLIRRERELLGASGPAWLEAIGIGPGAEVSAGGSGVVERGNRGSVVVFRRGFPDEAKLTLQQLLDASGALAAAPLRRLVITDASLGDRAALSALCRRVFPPSLADVCLRRWSQGDHAEMIAALPFLPQLEALALERVGLDGRVDVFANAPLPSLRALRIAEASFFNSRPPPEPYPFLAALRALTIEGVYGPLIQSFAGAQMPSLRDLRIVSGSLTGLADLAPGMIALESLDLEGSDASSQWALIRSDALPSLRVLNLRSCGADDALVSAVASSERPLARLDLSGSNRFGDEGIDALLRTRRLAKLRQLCLSARGLTRDQIDALRKKYGAVLELTR